MEKSNPSFDPFETWTFLGANPEETPSEPTKEPSNLEFAHAVLAAVRPFPGAYQAMLKVIETFWPPPPHPA